MKGLTRALCLGSAMMLFVSSVSQSFASISSFSDGTNGNIVERTSGGVTTEFGYDLVGQLVSETRSGYAASYTYDANGNRLTRTVNTVTEEYEYDGADKLLEVAVNSQTVKEFTYDAAGRTTSVTTSAGTTTLSWDYEDRLVGITYPNTSTNSFSYNAFGARVSKTDSSGTSTYARNGVSVVAPVLSDGSLTFTPGISTNNGSASTYSHGDIKNSLRQTGENESTSATKHYDAFGNETTFTGTWQGPFQYGGPFGYQTDTESGLKLLGHRCYDPSTGRFVSKDRAHDGRNWWVYAGSSPISSADPDGAAVVAVYYRPVEHKGVSTGAWHAYIVVSDAEYSVVDVIRGVTYIGLHQYEKPWAAGARPSRDGFGAFGAPLKFYLEPFVPGHPDWAHGDDPRLRPRKLLIRDDVPAVWYIFLLEAAAQDAARQGAHWWPWGPNSNASVRAMLDGAGLPVPSDHPVWVPGWSARLRAPSPGGDPHRFPQHFPEAPWYDPFQKPIP